MPRCLKLDFFDLFPSPDEEVKFDLGLFLIFVAFATANATSMFISLLSAERFFSPDNLTFLPPPRVEAQVPFMVLA